MWVGDVEKIDAKPIFTVPDDMPNLAIMFGTVKIGVAFVSFELNSNKLHCAFTLTIVPNRPCNPECKFVPEHFFQAKTCVRKCAIVRETLPEQKKQCEIFLCAIKLMLLHYNVIYMHTFPAANFCVQT